MISDELIQNAPENMKKFLMARYKFLCGPVKHEKRVWDKSVIKICHNLCSRSTKSYEDLVDSKIFQLPSGHNLRRFKNAVPQESGISDEIFHWMRNTAEKVNVHEAGYYGGLLHDEAKVQQDLGINIKGKTNQLVGWVDTSDECEHLRIIKDNQCLENTSKIIKFFRDTSPLISMFGMRMTEIRSAFHWFQTWRAEVSELDVSVT